MKSDPSQPQNESPTLDAASIAESTAVEGTNETTTSPTVQPSLSSSDGDTTKKGQKTKAKDREEKGSNLVGNILNLVSTDLNNVVDGRDFPMLLVALPLHAVFCIAFLYQVLGWSAIVGIMTMFALFPLPGWIASKMQTVQKEKMKMVSRASPLILRNFVSLRYFCCRRMRVSKLFLRS